MTTPNDAAVDVWAALGGLIDLARHRLTMKRRDFDRAVAAGKEPHAEVQIKADRAEYLLQQGDEAIVAIRELVEALQGVIAVADRETDEFIRARAALRRFATGGES